MSEFEQKQRELAEMAALEARLRQELARVEAPAGFAERVMARAAWEPVRMRRPSWVMFAVAAAVLVCAVIGGVRVQQEQRRERANAEFATAMQVTDRAMDRAEEHAREQMQRAGLDINEQDNGSRNGEEQR